MTDASAPAIQVSGLTKIYDKTRAVDGVNVRPHVHHPWPGHVHHPTC